MNEIFYHPLPLEEYKEAVYFYKERSEKAALRLQQLMERIENHILVFPEAGKTDEFYPDYRKRYVKDFPFTIIYRIQGKAVYILAIAHQSRHPDYWKDRLNPSTTTPRDSD